MTNRGVDRLVALSDDELEQGLRRLLGESARTEAGIVAHLAEVEERRLHLRAGYSSMFQYCLEHLGLSENEAFHRIVVARLAAAYPAVFELLETRQLHLSAICLLRRHLTRENHRELLGEACGKSKRQVEELLARRFPRSVSSDARAARFKRVNADCYRLELYVTKAQKEKLELARDLVSHANRSGDWGIVMERAADALVEKIQGRRFAKLKTTGGQAGHLASEDATRVGVRGGDGTDQARAANREPACDEEREPACGEEREQARRTSRHIDHSAKPPARPHIPNPVRRAVAARDDMSCTFTSESGRRCGARVSLQFDHLRAWARGGDETARNLRILCASHNRLLAEQEFGAAAVKRSVELRRAAASGATSNSATSNGAASSGAASSGAASNEVASNSAASPHAPRQHATSEHDVEASQPALSPEQVPKTAA